MRTVSSSRDESGAPRAAMSMSSCDTALKSANFCDSFGVSLEFFTPGFGAASETMMHKTENAASQKVISLMLLGENE